VIAQSAARRRPTPRWIAHAGLGINRPGGAPDATTLGEAVRLRVDRVELDVCTTADRRLVLRHDECIGGDVPLTSLRLAELRWLEPRLLTLDEGLEHLGDLPVLFDVKTDATAPVLARWLRARRDLRRFAVCTESYAALAAMREGAPRVERWRSFPDLGLRRREHVARVCGALLNHRRPGHAAFVARELIASARDVFARRDEGIARAGGVPWRRLLPLHLSRLCREVSAAGVCVHHWLYTPHLVEVAGILRLPVTIWTVNDAAALRRIAACGPVDMVTTDRVGAMRAAWASV
jgi:glycerophosphoryl diester phosphodiesterase